MENVLTVGWKVENTADKSMYFSIGAHPAFMCPLNGGNQSDYKLKFDTDKDIEYYLLDGGLIDKSKTYKLSICNGYANINAGMFDRDALIVEEDKRVKISLCYPDGMEYISVKQMRPYLAYGHQRVRMRRLFALNHGMDAAMLLGFMVTYPNVNIPIICLQVNSLAQNTLWNLINLKNSYISIIWC